MWTCRLFAIVVLAPLVLFAGTAAGEKKDSPPNITLPKDPAAVVVSYDPGAGGVIRKGPPPYLKIQADGQVIVTNMYTGAKKESKLTPEEVQKLLRFIVRDQDFFKVTAARIGDGIKAEAGNGPFLAVTGAAPCTVAVQVDGKSHEVTFTGAEAYLRAYPKVLPLAQLVAVQKRLGDLARSVEKGK